MVNWVAKGTYVFYLALSVLLRNLLFDDTTGDFISSCRKLSDHRFKLKVVLALYWIYLTISPSCLEPKTSKEPYIDVSL